MTPVRRQVLPWLPALVMLVAGVGISGIEKELPRELRAPLPGVLPPELDGKVAHDLELPERDILGAGMDSYVMRVYQDPALAGTSAWSLSLYVAYYERQQRGRTIHSPRNCLPGAGWEALWTRPDTLVTAWGRVVVNRSLVQKDDRQALVLHWYQGRGRVQHNEYTVKWELMRDAARHRRTDEALVRIMVPMTGSEVDATRLADQAAVEAIPRLFDALPI